VTAFAALYTDEDMSALVATLLCSRGLDVTTVPKQATLGKTDREQLEFATSLGRCILTHNRVDFEQLHLQYIQENEEHCGIIVVPQKNAYEMAQRIGILVSALTADEIKNQHCMHKSF
jgi:predicted nuclease of predicted toxin-antitoxin system